MTETEALKLLNNYVIDTRLGQMIRVLEFL